MSLPIEIINHIGQFVDIETYNNLKICNKEIFKKVINDEVIKKRNAKMVCLKYENYISNVVSKYYDTNIFFIAINNNKDRFNCDCCGCYVDNKIDKYIEKHLKYCMMEDYISFSDIDNDYDGSESS